MVSYPDVTVLCKDVDARIYAPDLLSKLGTVREPIGIKGGVAREMLKVVLGIATVHSSEKISDLDLVIFEDPMKTREERIARRNHYTSLVGCVEVKDLEFLEAREKGVVHYFLTRDVTMNEVLVFKTEAGFKFFYTPECRTALEERVIRPSIHCAHSGLDEVWILKDGKPVVHPNIVRRCIYRRVKDDGDTYDFGQFNMNMSVDLFDVDALFKLSKRFMHDEDLFKKCCMALIEFGFREEYVYAVIGMSAEFVKTPAKVMTSEKVEDLLEVMNRSFDQWRSEHPEPYFHATAKVVFV